MDHESWAIEEVRLAIGEASQLLHQVKLHTPQDWKLTPSVFDVRPLGGHYPRQVPIGGRDTSLAQRTYRVCGHAELMAAANGFVAFDIETDGLWNTETATPPLILCAVTMRVTRIGPGLFQCEQAIHWASASGEFMVRTQINEPGLFQCEKAIHWAVASGEFMVRTQINDFFNYLAAETRVGFPC